MTDVSNKTIDLRFAEEVLNRHNVDALADYVAEDFVEENPVPGQAPGRDGFRDFLTTMFQAFPDLWWQVEEAVAEGDAVMARSNWDGTHTAEFLGVPATGRHVTVEAWTRDLFRDGRITSSRILIDSLSLLQQLDAIPATV
jgi:steroid delta-isomerase-like uncharacterized protein